MTGSMSALTTWLAKQGFPGLHARHSHGDTPLMRAARQGEDAIVLALLACGAAPHAVNDEGNNALWFACLHGNLAVIRRLIEAGTPIDHANDDGLTCLMQAARRSQRETQRLLLDHGATADLYAPDGRSALADARRPQPAAETPEPPGTPMLNPHARHRAGLPRAHQAPAGRATPSARRRWTGMRSPTRFAASPARR